MVTAPADGGGDGDKPFDPVAYAQRLIDADIPVVVCKPNPNWTGGSNDVLPPAGWNTTTAPECDLSAFRPGIDTLAMVTGHDVDGVPRRFRTPDPIGSGPEWRGRSAGTAKEVHA
jgi:hypothetical protein